LTDGLETVDIKNILEAQTRRQINGKHMSVL